MVYRLFFPLLLLLLMLLVFGTLAEESEPGELRVAVLPFSSSADLDGAVCAELFATQLARSSKIIVVERSKLDAILKEQRLQASGFVSSETASEIGELSGATHLLMGEVSEDAKTIVISARLVDVESGVVVLSDLAPGSREAYLHTVINMSSDFVYLLTGEAPSLGGESLVPPEMLRAFQGFEENPNALVEESDFRLTVKLNREGDTPVYHLGETLSISAEVERDSYVYIFNISGAGGVKVIFPNQAVRDNFVAAGGSVHFPPEGANYEWELGAPAEGLEYIIAVATEVPVEFVPAFEELIAANAFPEIADDGGLFLTKQINVKLKEEKADTFGFGFVRFYLAE